MRRLSQPRVILLIVSATLLVFSLFASGKPDNDDCTTASCSQIPAKATELLWESFSHQFISAIATY